METMDMNTEAATEVFTDNIPSNSLDIAPVQNAHKDGGHSSCVDDDMVDEDETEWSRVQKRKRSRKSTSGRSGDGSDYPQYFDLDPKDFDKLSADAKSSATYNKLYDIGVKVDKCLSLQSSVNELEDRMNEHSDRITHLEYRSLDLEARSRRNNLIIGGIAESRNEDCLQAVSDFFKNHLEIDPCPPIQRTHRLGRFDRDRIRPIIILFLNYSDTELIISNAKKLRNTDYSINRDFPREIASARKELWPVLKRLRVKYPKSKISLAYPAKIIKDGQVHSDLFPNWNLILRREIAFGSVPASASVDQSQPRDARASHESIDVGHPRRAAVSGSQSDSGVAPDSESSRVHRRKSRSPPKHRPSREHAPARNHGSSDNNSDAQGADPGIRRPWDSPPPVPQSQQGDPH